jgi:hypothetical protein
LNSPIGDADASYGSIEANVNLMSLKPLLQLLAIQSTQRDPRDLNFESSSVAEKSIEKNFARITTAEAIRSFVEGAG